MAKTRYTYTVGKPEVKNAAMQIWWHIQVDKTGEERSTHGEDETYVHSWKTKSEKRRYADLVAYGRIGLKLISKKYDNGMHNECVSR